MKLQFISTPSFLEYHSASLDCYQGDVKHVSEEEGERLLKDFPENFKPFKEEKVREGKEEKKIKGSKETKTRG